MRIGLWPSRHSWIGWLVALQAVAAHGAAPRLFDMTTETGMPHLEENLRYAVVSERRCIGEADLATAFWMLRDVSLQDCTLQREPGSTAATGGEAGADRRYVLACTGGHGTTGNAHWKIEENALTGTLNVRLGGKNMTFYQRITARPVGACTAP